MHCLVTWCRPQNWADGLQSPFSCEDVFTGCRSPSCISAGAIAFSLQHAVMSFSTVSHELCTNILNTWELKWQKLVPNIFWHKQLWVIYKKACSYRLHWNALSSQFRSKTMQKALFPIMPVNTSVMQGCVLKKVWHAAHFSSALCDAVYCIVSCRWPVELTLWHFSKVQTKSKQCKVMELVHWLHCPH